jgi:PAS domain S-box-containing protein
MADKAEGKDGKPSYEELEKIVLGLQEELIWSENSHSEFETLVSGLSKCNSIDETLHIILDVAIEVCNMDSGGIYQVKNDKAVLIASKGLPEEFVKIVRERPIDLDRVRKVIESDTYVNLREISPESASFYDSFNIDQCHSIKLNVGSSSDSPVFGFINVSTKKSNEGKLKKYSIQNLYGVKLNVESTWGRIHALDSLNKALELLSTSEQRHRELIEDLPVGVVTVDLHNMISYANKMARNMMGYSFEERKGKLFYDLLHPDDLNRVLDKMKKRLDGQPEEEPYEIRIIKNNNDIIYSKITPRSIIDKNEDKVSEIMILLEDVTKIRIAEDEKKKAEVERETLQIQYLQAQKMESIGILAGGLAHDFNNALQAITGYSELLAFGKKEDDPNLSKISAIHNAARRSADIVRQLLTFSRKVESNKKPLNINYCVNDAVKMLGRSIPKTIEINSLLMPDDDRYLINADPTQIEQVIMNISLNAKDAMPDGGTLCFKTENTSIDEEFCKRNMGAKPGNYILLRVTDTGTGIPKKNLEHIYDPFFSTKEVGKGTGLGLASVYGIVKNHDGYIKCESEVGKGTTFCIYLPVIENQQKEVLENKVMTEFYKGSGKILLIDDEEDIRNLLGNVLTSSGYEVTFGEDGEAGVSKYKTDGPFNLVVLDINMPKKDGGACLKEIMDLDPEAKVLIATGYGKSSEKELMDMGAKGFVYKPHNLVEFTAKVKDIIEKDNYK